MKVYVSSAALSLALLISEASLSANGVVHIPEPTGGWGYDWDRDKGITFGSSYAITADIDGLVFKAPFHFFTGEIYISNYLQNNGLWLSASTYPGDMTLLVNEGVQAIFYRAVTGISDPSAMLDNGGTHWGIGGSIDTSLTRLAEGVLQINGATVITQSDLLGYVTESGAQTLANKTLNSPTLSGSTTIGGSVIGQQVKIDGSTGNLGVGMTPTTSKLAVAGKTEITAASGASATTELIRLQSGGGSNADGTTQRIAGYTDVLTAYIDIKRFSASGPITGMTFGTYTGDAMTIRSNTSTEPAKVGIGTNNPAAKLDVNGTVQISGTVQLASDVKVKNKAVIRVSPAGDINMGGFTAGTDPFAP